MTRLPNLARPDLPENMSLEEVQANRFTLKALERHKREGLDLAVRARLVALAVIAIMLPFLNANLWQLLYFEAFILAFAVNGLLQQRVGRVGRSGAELALLFVDVAMMTFMLTFPPPFWAEDWPHAMTYRFGSFIYFYVILAAGTLMYNWRTIMAVGNWSVGLWILGIVLMAIYGREHPDLTTAAHQAFGQDRDLAFFLDPNALRINARVQEIVVFLIVAYTLALTVRRFNRLLLGNAALERTRENLSRYFSPNVVDELAGNDTPLREVREQDVAVLFVDLVGFTAYAADRPARDVIETLRQFHARMEACVFDHNGTLDKYLGDGLMATFGTPIAQSDDGARALACARAMLKSVADLNIERAGAGQVPLQISVGLHSGPVVLGDIGTNRLEFAVIGNTVNVASRMEGLTRQLDTSLVVSEDAYDRAKSQGAQMQGLDVVAGQTIRGLSGAVQVWRLR